MRQFLDRLKVVKSWKSWSRKSWSRDVVLCTLSY